VQRESSAFSKWASGDALPGQLFGLAGRGGDGLIRDWKRRQVSILEQQFAACDAVLKIA